MKNKPQLFTLLPFMISIAYWIYLICTTQMVIVFDAVTYQNIARIIFEQGLLGYYQTGPHNEPLYPLLIALSMKLGQIGGVDHLRIQAALQLCFLLWTQYLVFRILRHLDIHKNIIFAAVLYAGFSPALVNTAINGWSEIVVIPLVTLLVLLVLKFWENIRSSGQNPHFGYAAGIAAVLSLLVSVKALFEFISIPLFLLIIPGALVLKRGPQKENVKRFAASCALILLIFQGYIFTIKSVNKHFNGHFATADRGPRIVYGNVVKRTNPLTMKQWAAGLAFIPGDGICSRIFDEKTCYYWSLHTVDEYGIQKMHELLDRGLSGRELDKKLLSLSIEKIFAHPLQYFTLTFLEGWKMFFWESTRIGFVIYPDWLDKLFTNAVFKNGIRLFMSLLTFAAVVLSARSVIGALRRPRRETPDNVLSFSVFSLALIVSYIGFYSIFFIHTRYLLPIVPVYILLISVHIDRYLKKRVWTDNSRE